MKVAVAILLAFTFIAAPITTFAQQGSGLSEAQQGKVDAMEARENSLMGRLQQLAQFSPTYQIITLPFRLFRSYQQHRRTERGNERKAEEMRNGPVPDYTNPPKESVKAGVEVKPGAINPSNPGTRTGTGNPGTKGGTVSPGTTSSGGKGGSGGTGGGSSTGGSSGGTKPVTDDDDDGVKKKSGSAAITAFEDGVTGTINWMRSLVGF